MEFLNEQHKFLRNIFQFLRFLANFVLMLLYLDMATFQTLAWNIDGRMRILTRKIPSEAVNLGNRTLSIEV